MASEISAPPVNGNYAPHQGYGGIEQSNNGYAFNGTTTDSTSAAQASSSTTATSSAGQSDIPKDEVGWFFVEQYYTTLSRNPEKLYLFYAKRSQLVSGQETEKVQVCVGHRAINDKIKALDFQDCKVRVTNVDSQSSDQNIVIQVVGEISNKSQPHKKFVQTFVLAEQTNGYFVLNDIFRYLVEEEDDYEAEASAQPEIETGVQAGEAANNEKRDIETYVDQVNTLTNLHDPVATEPDANVIAKELEEKLIKDQPAAESVSVNGEKEEPTKSVESSPQLPVQTEVTADPELAPEKPKDPEPTPVASPPKAAAPPAPTQTAVPKPAVPAAPKTWANLAAAANKVATPIVPAPAAASTAAPAARATPPSGKTPTPAATNATTPAPATAATAAAAPAAAPSQRSDAPSADSQDEWNTVGASHARQQSRQTNTAQPETPQYRGYIKNVYEHVDSSDLRTALEKFGEVAYFDIARQKNCAFVDFKTADGYNKATSTPIEIGDDKLFVEERRVRPGSTPFVPRPFPPGRGGRGGVTGGQAPGGPRGGFQGPRGGFNPRGRGNGAGQRGGRGAAQAS